MTNNIGRIIGGGNNYIGGFGAKKQEEAKDAKQQEQVLNNYNETQVDPAKIMDYLAGNNVFLNPAKQAVEPGKLDAATQNRVADSMADFELVFGIIEKEVGPELAPLVMDEYMNRNLGL